jgi:predicted Rossmann fold flavoprotein
VDLAVVGAGAAGLATAIFTARLCPGAKVCALDGARTLGAKILVSGGGRCNVTNSVVGETDFWGGRRAVIRRVLRSFSAQDAVAFFREIGVALHEEPGGKLFPDSGRARTVLDALLAEARGREVRLLTDHRVLGVERDSEGFTIETSQGRLAARRVALATGGLSLPKTGSDGSGYRFASHLGHSIVSPTPALAPLLLDGGFHTPLAGVSCEAEITVRAEGLRPQRLRGPLLWTHFGISGPVALDASRHWHRARALGQGVTLFASFLPGTGFEAAERLLLDLASARPRTALQNALAILLPSSMAAAVVKELGADGTTPLAQLPRDTRRRLVHALIEWPLPVRDSRGYGFAEVTAGGVPLAEIDPATMESRRCQGLLLVGEILDVDGRLGGFNFQWAWSSAWVAACGLAASLKKDNP